MKPTLLIMAAGMGSRYGGLKQMEPMGPNGSTLLDYSVYDAMRAGFGKVVFVIRHDIEADFKKIVGKKWESTIPVRYVFQELAMVPEGFKVPQGRQKPWGTGHAVWVAQGAVQEPFAAINADDYYGRSSFKVLAGFLKKIKKTDSSGYSMVGFPLDKTLSEHGTVARGVCRLAQGRRLREVVERTQIGQEGRKVFYLDESGKKHPLKRNEVVSMNMWGFTPLIFRQLDKRFGEFLKEKGQDIKSEFLIPRVVDDAIASGESAVKVLSTQDRWFGVTYPQDREIVRENILNFVKRKVYPALLWE
ncbi:MAG TPA: sugar phosphate nucleotidyltransferase [bacterium]|jgi:UTP-glucose-1-phosphate uridylyltransferase|nr:sugar phosphate nucleotidyltransferase [bacterium]